MNDNIHNTYYSNGNMEKNQRDYLQSHFEETFFIASGQHVC